MKVTIINARGMIPLPLFMLQICTLAVGPTQAYMAVSYIYDTFLILYFQSIPFYYLCKQHRDGPVSSRNGKHRTIFVQKRALSCPVQQFEIVLKHMVIWFLNGSMLRCCANIERLLYHRMRLRYLMMPMGRSTWPEPSIDDESSRDASIPCTNTIVKYWWNCTAITTTMFLGNVLAPGVTVAESRPL